MNVYVGVGDDDSSPDASLLHSDVLKIEREDLYEQHANLTASISRDQKALTAVDDNILNKLTQAATALLDNEELLAAFYEAKVTTCWNQNHLSLTHDQASTCT